MRIIDLDRLKQIAVALLLLLEVLLGLLPIFLAAELDLAVTDALEGLVAVADRSLSGPDLVDGIREEEHLDALLLEGLEMRRSPQHVELRSRDEVDRLLLLGHTVDVVAQGDERVLVGGLERRAAQGALEHDRLVVVAVVGMR